MILEVVFLIPIILSVTLGAVLGGYVTDVATAPPAPWLQALGGSILGYLVGCGLVWGVRILGTLGFGREAMGMGDVHLLGCIGAVMGWFDPILVFFIAPFIGLAWTLIAWLASALGSRRRELPYGPHLALAALLVLLARPLVVEGWNRLLPQVPMPQRALIQDASGSDAEGLGIDRMSTFRRAQLDSRRMSGFNIGG
ncbi:MAG: A24 family peptidase [Phycisphaerales bacterium]|nr:A24 family peptidase [Phycisphaerales bacterium]